MVFVTSIISSQEWIRLSEAAQQAFPNEVLARGEIMRRFSLSGVAALKAASEAEKKKAQHEHQEGRASRKWACRETARRVHHDRVI
jgi:hypothetical protein